MLGSRRTPQYLAPEVLAPTLETDGYTNAVDWYAFGCLLVRRNSVACTIARAAEASSRSWRQYEMLTGRAAWGGPYSTPEEVFALSASFNA